MKKIDAIVRPHCLGDVVTRLRLVGVSGLTVAEVHGLSASTQMMGVFRGERYIVPSAPRAHVMVVVPDELAEATVRAIALAACTEHAGDGLVAVGDVSDVVRIRTGEHGVDAL
jgi:nitrogen regulatory protein P-II 1